MNFTVANLGQLNTAMATAKSGDVVLFTGAFNFNSWTIPVDGVIFDGQQTATLTPGDGKAAFLYPNNRTATIRNFQSIGTLWTGNGTVTPIVYGNDITGFDAGLDSPIGRCGMGGWMTLGAGTTIVDNNLHDSPNGRGFAWFTGLGTAAAPVTISYNRADNIFLFQKSNNSHIVDSSHVYIDGNWVTNCRYHGMEDQGCINGLWFRRNRLEKYRHVDGNNQSEFMGSMIYTTPSSDQHFIGNYVSGWTRNLNDPYGNWCPLGLEIGENAEIVDNYIEWCYSPYTAWKGALNTRNRCVNCIQGAHSEGGGTITGDNSATAPLSWEPSQWFAVGPRDRSDKYFGTGAAVYPDPMSGAASSPTTGGTTMLSITPTAISKAKDSLNVSWPSVDGAASYHVYISTADGGNQTDLKTTTKTSVVISGLHAAWEFIVAVYALNAKGENIGKGTVKFRTMGTIGDAPADSGSAGPAGTSTAKMSDVADTTQSNPTPTIDYEFVTLKLGKVAGKTVSAEVVTA